LKNKDKLAYLTAKSISASFKIILGDLPPNSKVTLLIFGKLDLAIISLPTAVDPVKETLSTNGWAHKA